MLVGIQTDHLSLEGRCGLKRIQPTRVRANCRKMANSSCHLE